MRREKSYTIKTIKRVMPAVVTVVIKKSLTELKKELAAESVFSSRAGKRPALSDAVTIPKDKIDARGMVQVDCGSGFIVDSKGVILTNKHVVSELNAEYTVITNDEEEFSAELLARDPVNDIAILKISAKKSLPFLRLGDSSRLELGQTVFAFGNALGLFKSTASKGIISGLSLTITAYPGPNARAQEMRGLIQTDAAINPGNSGGPLTDLFGRVIGINAAIISDAENIGLAIPVHVAERDIQDLKKYGRIKRPLLGIHYTTISKDLSKKLNLPVSHGALVIREHPMEKAVVPERPADKAGIIENDIILEWNGEEIISGNSVLDFLEKSEVGESATLSIMRDGDKKDIKVLLGERK